MTRFVLKVVTFVVFHLLSYLFLSHKTSEKSTSETHKCAKLSSNARLHKIQSLKVQQPNDAATSLSHTAYSWPYNFIIQSATFMRTVWHAGPVKPEPETTFKTSWLFRNHHTFSQVFLFQFSASALNVLWMSDTQFPSLIQSAGSCNTHLTCCQLQHLK